VQTTTTNQVSILRGRKVTPSDAIPVAKEEWLSALDKFMRSLPELSQDRKRKYRYTILKFAKEIKKSPDDVTRKDLEWFFDSRKEMGLTLWTVSNYKIMLKRFYRKRRGKRFVEWIKIPKNIPPSVGPEDIITPEEWNRMIDAAETIRDKALVSSFFEGDFRPGEFLSQKIKNVTFDQYGARIHVEKGKTGPRTVRVINSSPYLANWIENHPNKKDKDSALWIAFDNSRKGMPLQDVGLRKIVKRIALKARIRKRVWPYLFRHSRNTELSTILTEAPFCEVAGWKQGSSMPSFYVHLSGKNVDDAILRGYGIVKDHKKQELPKTCPRCTMVCAPQEERCHRCGLALSLKAAMEEDKTKADRIEKLERKVAFLDDPKVKKLIEEALEGD
jgi:integrase/recombinase XerD